ncbi:MAG TPA: protein-disulfide reductase DsbD domain-containing protein, partial [Vicinamibacteria bacterium]|nr:protein-disulfide reductase DsbD domain-containing protein [Vicinamibacteria bacterium]
AETEGHEGAYYTWTREELEALLPVEDRGLFTSVYGLDGPPTFEADRYVLHLARPLAESAPAHGLSEADLRARLEPGRRALFEARGRRPRPLVDDKVLADWNGLMIEAMARGGERLGERAYLEAARRAAAVVLTRLRDPEGGTLLHGWREGRARIPAFLDDYAFLISGLLALRAVTGEERWQAEAARLAAEQELRLGDPVGGYFAAGEDPRLLFRAKPAFDGAVASGNGVAALNLTQLGRLTGEASFLSRAEGVLGAFGGAMSAMPLAHVSLVRAWHRWRATPRAPVPAAPAATAGLEDTARNVVEVSGQLAAGTGAWRRFVVELAIRPGWHLNAHPASLPTLVATSLGPVLGQLRSLRYPAGEPFGPPAEPISVYRGRVALEGEIEPPAGGAPSLELTYQACDDTRCLPPVTRLVRLR